jgi:hypothetical protein
MDEPTPLNKPLIVFTLVSTIVGEAYSHFTPPRQYSEGRVLAIGLGILVLSPIFIAWTRALWNTLVPRITGWREITLWEAAGLSAMVFFLAG